jgi:hypothetical protein
MISHRNKVVTFKAIRNAAYLPVSPTSRNILYSSNQFPLPLKPTFHRAYPAPWHSLSLPYVKFAINPPILTVNLLLRLSFIQVNASLESLPIYLLLFINLLPVVECRFL